MHCHREGKYLTQWYMNTLCNLATNLHLLEHQNLRMLE
jgi:hypothetical protein